MIACYLNLFSWSISLLAAYPTSETNTMGFSLSKLRLGNRHPVESPNSEAIPPQAHNHDVPHTARRKPQRIGTTFRHDEPEASGSHSTESHLSTEGRETNTYVETESSHIPSSPQVRVKKNRQVNYTTTVFLISNTNLTSPL